MSQDYVAMYRARWAEDKDWRALSMAAQWTYDMLLQHPDRNAAGVLSLTVKKWVRLAHGLTVADLRRALTELDDTGFIVVDEDTEEVLVRSYIRNGKVYKHVRLFLNALRDVSSVESEQLKSALGQELMLLPEVIIPAPNGRNEVAIVEAERARLWHNDLASQLCDSPPEPPGHGVAHPMGHGMASETAHPLPHPPGVGAGTGAGVGTGTALGSCSSSENESLESNARAKPLIGLCPKHPGETARKCRGCAADRKAAS